MHRFKIEVSKTDLQVDRGTMEIEWLCEGTKIKDRPK